MFKKLISIAFVMLYVISMQAQIRLGAKGGWNLSTFHAASESGIVGQYTNDYSGFHAGILLDIILSDYFSIQPELLLSKKGGQNKLVITESVPSSIGYLDVTITTESFINPYYLEFPVHFKTRFKTGNTEHFVIGAGPYIALGVEGRYKIETTYDPEFYISGTYQEKITGEMALFKKETLILRSENGSEIAKNDFEDTLLRRFDTGVSLFAGYEFTNLFVTLGYKIGLYNIDNTPDSEKLYNRLLSVSIGYKFKK